VGCVCYAHRSYRDAGTEIHLGRAWSEVRELARDQHRANASRRHFASSGKAQNFAIGSVFDNIQPPRGRKALWEEIAINVGIGQAQLAPKGVRVMPLSDCCTGELGHSKWQKAKKNRYWLIHPGGAVWAIA